MKILCKLSPVSINTIMAVDDEGDMIESQIGSTEEIKSLVYTMAKKYSTNTILISSGYKTYCEKIVDELKVNPKFNQMPLEFKML